MVTIIPGFVLVLALAAFLRFFKVRQRGILFWDDGLRMREVLFLDDLIVFVKSYFNELLRKKIDFKQASSQFRGRFVFENPLNIFIYYFTSKITRDLEHSGLVSNAFFGVLGIVGVFFSASAMWSPMTGLIAALILSLSGYHLMYSRSIHAEVTSGACFIWAVYFYWLSLGSPLRESNSFFLALSGFLAGCAFCCNIRQFHMPLLLVTYEVIYQIFYLSHFSFNRFFLLSIGMIMPLILIQEFFAILKELGYPYWTLLRILFDRSGHIVRPSLLFPSGGFYLKIIFGSEGWIVPVLALLGLFQIFLNVSFQGIIIAAQLLLPVFIWSSRPKEVKTVSTHAIGTYQLAVPRLISGYVYGMAIAAAVGLTVLKSVYFYPLLSAVLMIGIYHAYQIFQTQSKYKKVIEFISANSNGRHFSANPEISDFYLGREKTINIYDLKQEEMDAIYKKEKVNLFLYMNGPNRTFVQILSHYIQNLTPAYSIDMGVGSFWPLRYDESTPSTDVSVPFSIAVYDLKEYFENRKVAS